MHDRRRIQCYRRIASSTLFMASWGMLTVQMNELYCQIACRADYLVKADAQRHPAIKDALRRSYEHPRKKKGGIAVCNEDVSYLSETCPRIQAGSKVSVSAINKYGRAAQCTKRHMETSGTFAFQTDSRGIYQGP
ncbi:hypothetical protein OE88DRAFT_1751746 [Heliocybe sulcata]|uniref:Uncharacterized protein n=1 Tax=Heliocybe sulcata TaxID=5364 RepID=A0A5C3MZR4_9AGAM|nr:hypothetical protein OE88DRAFT_1751746 [Heliocybe sulcata]